MSEQNKEISSQETEDRRDSRTGFGDRSERNQSGKTADRRDDERTPQKRSERSYFDSKGKYQGRPIDDGDGEGKRNTFNDLPSRSPSGRDNYRQGGRDSQGRSDSRGRADSRGRNDRGESRTRNGSWSRKDREEQTGSDRRPQRDGFKGRPVERDENRSPAPHSDRDFRGGDRQRDNSREDSRGGRDNRGRFESRDRGESRAESRGRNDSWNRGERGEQSGSDSRPQRDGFRGRPVERSEGNRNGFDRSDRSDSRRSDRDFRGEDRQRDNRREDSRGGRDNRDRFDSRNRGENRGEIRGRNDSWNRGERGEQSGSDSRPQRDGFRGRPVERSEANRNGFDRSDRSDSRRSDRDFRGGDRQRDNRREDFRGGRDNRGRFESSDRRDSGRPFSERSDRRDSGNRRFESRGRNDRPSRPQEGKRDGNEAFGKRPMRYDASAEGAPRNNRPEAKGKPAENRPPRPEKKPFVPAKPSVPNLNEPLRINKALAFAGICSRRAADDLIAQGVVFVNGVKVEEPGLKLIPISDVLEVNAERVVFNTEKAEPLYVLLHKPVQTVCTANDPEGRPTVLDILPEEFKEKRIFPVGRLDFFSTGLLLLTNDGELTHRLTHPKWHQTKVYRVRVRGDVPEEVLEKFRRGMTLEEGEKLAPVECKILAHDEGNTRVEMVLTQGINRQIRRMFRDVELTILNLHRVKIGPIQIGELDKGESRELTPEELAELYKATGLSS